MSTLIMTIDSESDAETNAPDSLTAFNSNGFSLGNDGGSNANAQTFDSAGNHGYWRNEKIYESPGRSLAIVSGIALLGVSVVIKF